MGGHVGSSWSLTTTTHHGGTTIIGGWLTIDQPIVGWLTSDRPIGSPLTCRLIGRSTCKWSIGVSLTSI